MNQSTISMALWPPLDPNSSCASNTALNHSTLASLQSPYSKGLNGDTESVLSGYSVASKKNRPLAGNGTYGLVNSPGTLPNHVQTNGPINPYHGNYQPNVTLAQAASVVSAGRQSHYSNRNGPTNKVEPLYNTMSANHADVVPSAQPDWADNTTAITGNTSDHSISLEDLSRLDKESVNGNFQQSCQMWSGMVIALVLSVCAFLSPIIMVILPKMEVLEWKTKECGPECDGLLISFVFKLLILAVGSWAVFLRRPKATFPRVVVYRAAVLTLVVIFMIAYWLFYSVRIAEKRFSEEDAISYYSIVLFAISLVDALLFIHYLAVILLEIRHLNSQYFIKVVRSPDGYSQCYNLGQISIQRASVWILEKYYQDFPIYNPYLDRVPLRRSRKTSITRHGSAALKYYNVDGPSNVQETNQTGAEMNLNSLQLSPKSILAVNTAVNAGRPARTYMNGGGTISDGRGGRRAERALDTASHHSGHSSHHHRHHSDRFYEEHEYERRVRKRKARLVSVTEEAFAHIRRAQQDRTAPAVPMDPKEAAQSIFPSVAKILQKYLRITRQQTRHSVQSILEHLTICLSYDLSPKAFLEKYLANSPVLASDEEKRPVQTWSLICDTLLSRSIEAGTMFLLRQGDVSLLVSVHRLPHFHLTEEIIDPKNNRFIFKLNSETSV